MNIFKSLAKLKVYFNRAINYISIINFILIFGTFKRMYDIQISIFLLIPVGLILALIIGIIDYNMILRYETEHNNKQNDVKDQIERIENKLNKLLEV